jgi:hypothetical protein
MNREEAEKHWEYTAKIIELSGHVPSELEHFLYVEAMLHGAKHERERIAEMEKR